MARPLRIVYPGTLYHITARGNARQSIYKDDADRRALLMTLTAVVAMRAMSLPHPGSVVAYAPQAGLAGSRNGSLRKRFFWSGVPSNPSGGPPRPGPGSDMQAP